MTAGLPLAQKVLALIREDFKEGSATDTHETLLEELNSLKTEKISAYDQLLRQHLELPEADRTKPRLVAERAAAIAEIVEVQRSIRAVQKNPVIDLLDALEKALDKLGAIQRFGDSPKSFAEFASAVSEFSQKSVLMINAIRDLREATRD
ncbi:MAG TPA: hypothetical protein DEA08_06795 [Planctomycetes bacterium]|nr:hypothetical protein [Planctomycetota bacterium]